MRERNHIENSLNVFHAFEKELSDAVELIDMGEAEGDIEVVEEAEAALCTAPKVGGKAGT